MPCRHRSATLRPRVSVADAALRTRTRRARDLAPGFHTATWWTRAALVIHLVHVDLRRADIELRAARARVELRGRERA